MAEETPMSPISEAVPPKANPLATPASAHAPTLKLKPAIKRPVIGGATATQTALKPGLKLPPKPGLSTAGLKLPPKPGATQTALKPGLKLPARPVIRKPGAAASPIIAPIAPKSAAPAAPVADLPKVEQPKPLEALKAVTQNLKSITAPIPQQAILRKTGIIADAQMTEAQKQAAKSKTARISLSDAMGVAPVKNEAMPMKTIRIKRPADLAGAPSSAAATTPDAPSAAVDTQAETKPATVAEGTPTSFTQRKTIKISRTGGTAVRPTGKFGIKRPAASAPAAAPSAPSGDVPEIADIPDMPSAPVAPVPLAAKNLVPDVPKGVAIAGLIVQIAACATIGVLGWLLIQDAQLPLYCGGIGLGM